MLVVFLLSLFLLFNALHAIPIFGIGQTDSKEPVSNVSSAETDTLVRPALFVSVAYCTPGAISKWECPSCQVLGPQVELVAVGGDDDVTPVFFIAHDTTDNSVVVSHEGTEPANFSSVLNDLEFLLVPIDPDLFPNATGQNIKVHDGFQKTFKRTAQQVLLNVTNTLNATGAKKVHVVGHSLGAAIGVMDAVFLRTNLDPDVEVVPRVFGLPRGGNQEWADFVDQTVPNMLHIHNKNDPIGIVPPRSLGFQHPSGEFHIQSDNTTLNCPGQENQDQRCIAGQELLQDLGDLDDHRGPYYQGVLMGGGSCNV